MLRVSVGGEGQNIGQLKKLYIMPGSMPTEIEEQKKEIFESSGKFKLMPPVGRQEFLIVDLFLV